MLAQPHSPARTHGMPALHPAQWHAQLDLRFARRHHSAGATTVLAHASHQGPLRVQKALYPEGASICHTVILHPPGGIAGGDQLAMDVEVGQGAHAVLTTPGATRWYKARGRAASQHVRLHVQQDAILEWLPQENMLFAGADATLALELHLHPAARAMGWDATVLGRYGAGELWHRAEDDQGTTARLALHNRILCNGMPLWLEQGRIDAGSPLLHSPAGMAGFPVQATLWAAGPGCTAAQTEALGSQLPWNTEVRAGVSLLTGTANAPPLLLLRLLARRMETARQVLLETWRLLRPALLGCPAVPLRLWAT